MGIAIDLFWTRCIFGELLRRKAILPGRNEVEQLDLIYRLLGTPTGAALDRLKRCEGWEKMKVAESFNPSLREKFRSYVSHDKRATIIIVCSATPLEIDLLERLLSLNPDTVISRI